MKASRLAFFGWTAAVLVSAAGLGCGGSGGSNGGGKGGASGHACIPGMSVACACTNGSQGAQVCTADGAAYGACKCDAAQGMAGATGAGGGAGSAGIAGTAGASGTAGSVATAGTTGAAGATGAGGAAGAAGRGGAGGNATGTAGAGAAGRGGTGGATAGAGGTSAGGTGGGSAGAGGTSAGGTGGGSAGAGGTSAGGTGGGSSGSGGGQPSNVNLIKNGDFSLGGQDWNVTWGGAQVGNPSFMQNFVCIYNGTLGVVLYNLAYPADPADAFAIEPGATYTFSYDAVSSDIYGMTVNVDIRGAAAPNTVVYTYTDQSDYSYKTLTHTVVYTSGGATGTADAVKAAEGAAGVVFRGTLLSSQQNCFRNVRFVRN